MSPSDDGYERYVKDLVDSQWCPRCGKRCVQMGVAVSNTGHWIVTGAMECETPDCPNSIYTENGSWIFDSSSYPTRISSNTSN